MISGRISVAFIRFFLRLNILFLAITLAPNPFRGLKILREISMKRRKVQALPPVKKFLKAGGRYFFSENIPGWPSSAFNAFFRGEIDRIVFPGKRPALSTAIFAITSKCRLRCGHCYEWNNISDSEWLTSDDLKSAASKLIDFGVSHLQLSGGEPLERFDDLVELIKFTHTGCDVWMLTSGYGLTAEKAGLLRKAGLTGVDISLDHWNADDHDRSRNCRGSFSQAINAIRYCNDAGLATAFSLCAFRSFVTRENLEMYAKLAREMHAGIIRVLDPRATGRYKGIDVDLDEGQIRLLEEFYLSMNRSAGFEDLPVVTYPGYQQRRLGCSGAGNRYLYIDSKGEIHSCPFCLQSAGNIKSVKLEEAVERLKSTGCHLYRNNHS